jgi:DNA-binding winged helix-turn-helix (wHTH) protein
MISPCLKTQEESPIFLSGYTGGYGGKELMKINKGIQEVIEKYKRLTEFEVTEGGVFNIPLTTSKYDFETCLDRYNKKNISYPGSDTREDNLKYIFTLISGMTGSACSRYLPAFIKDLNDEIVLQDNYCYFDKGIIQNYKPSIEVSKEILKVLINANNYSWDIYDEPTDNIHDYIVTEFVDKKYFRELDIFKEAPLEDFKSFLLYYREYVEEIIDEKEHPSKNTILEIIDGMNIIEDVKKISYKFLVEKEKNTIFRYTDDTTSVDIELQPSQIKFLSLLRDSFPEFLSKEDHLTAVYDVEFRTYLKNNNATSKDDLLPELLRDFMDSQDNAYKDIPKNLKRLFRSKKVDPDSVFIAVRGRGYKLRKYIK